jgi:hypothetical protein
MPGATADYGRKSSVLVMGAREAEGRQAAPTAVVLDCQSVKTTEAGGPRGFDTAKKVKGRTRRQNANAPQAWK